VNKAEQEISKAVTIIKLVIQRNEVTSLAGTGDPPGRSSIDPQQQSLFLARSTPPTERREREAFPASRARD